MKYVIGDIHGCYREYQELLLRIGLSEEEDQLYILGDALDRGPEPIRVLQDISRRKNTFFILGNHEYLFLYFIGKMGMDLSKTEELSAEDVSDFQSYLMDGGLTTMEGFMKLSFTQRAELCTFLKKADKYREIFNDGKRYLLVHAGIQGFQEEKELEKYDVLDFICGRTDYKKRYFQDPNTYVVTGHTPTRCINLDGSSQVYQKKGHIAVDCGCVYGGRLCAYCIDTGEITYVEAERR